MSICSLEFLVILCLLSALIFLLPGVRSRRFLMAASALGFLYSQGLSRSGGIVLTAFLLSGYACARLLEAKPSRVVFTTYIFALTATFVFLKRYDFLRFIVPPWLFDDSIAIVGLSYMLFRQIHFIVDAMQGQIKHPPLWTYLNYQLNPFTLLAGPIARYQQFEDSWTELAPVLPDRHEILKAYLRVFWGIIKVVIISAAFQSLQGQLLEQISAGSPAGPARIARFVMLLYAYIFYLYFNFSGYCDVVIAGASLVGLRLPENFDAPFLSRNILEYWTRWHITLGFWIRDYLFTPFYKAGVERFPKRTLTMVVISYFFAFSLAGLWHGATLNYLIYGLLNGAGLSAAKLWEYAIIKRSGRPGLRRYLAQPAIRWIATFITFNYVCITLFFFAYNLDECMTIVASVLNLSVRGY